MLKIGKVTLTSDYQNVGTLLSAVTDRPYGDGRTLRRGGFINTGAEVITLAIGSDDDNVSLDIAIGQTLPFEEVNLSHVYAKAASSASELSFHGDE